MSEIELLLVSEGNNATFIPYSSFQRAKANLNVFIHNSRKARKSVNIRNSHQ